MKWALKGGVVSVFALLVMVGCQASKKKAADAKPSWAGQMQGLANEVRELIPFIYSRQAFFDPANADKIKAGLKKFSAQTHSINPEMGKSLFGNDPIVAYSLESLHDDVQRANDAFALGQLEYARGVSKTVLNHCFRCHSMTKEGAKAQWDVASIPQLNLSPLERADLFVATRSYEEAGRFLEGLLSDQQFVQNYPFDFELALRKYLSLMIRAENDPDRPLHELDRILQMKGIPFYVGEQARSWRQSLLEWSKAKAKLKKSKKNPLAVAKERIQRASDLQQYAKDHAGDIEYLRTTSLLHDYLKSEKNAKDLSEAYYLLGVSYEVLDDLGSWNLHEIYFESCIRQAPKSALAKKCYGRLESSVFLGFSGSSGTHIPSSETQRLKKLKDLML